MAVVKKGSSEENHAQMRVVFLTATLLYYSHKLRL
jgi:hypothetical protein